MLTKSPRGAATPLFLATIAVLAVLAGVGLYLTFRAPSVGPEEVTRAFLDAARAQRFDEARTYCTGDLGPSAVRSWMVGGFEYRLAELENQTTSTADIEADVEKAGQRFTLRFTLYNGDNRWRISTIMRVQ